MSECKHEWRVQGYERVGFCSCQKCGMNTSLAEVLDYYLCKLQGIEQE